MLDELHRTGAKEWGDRLNTLIDNQPKNTKVLGITATPRRDSDGINMANEMAERLGYTNREAASGKHIAMNMSLTNAIRMGLVVNPKLISCAYNLKNDSSLDKLKGKIDQIEDIQKRNEKLEEYEKLRRSIENADGISEVLQANIKKGGKYIVFLPIVDEIEDEDGNVIGRKTGKDKIQDYERQIAEYFTGSDITPNFHSMLGEYGDKENERRLEEFQNRDTDDTEFMLVMNKANEGLHLEKLDGMIWLRPMDENSRILYLQQLGRVIYSEDSDNPTKDEDRPVVIDLVNNTLKVNWENEVTEQDDIELLTIIVDWVEKHDGTLPNINSTDKEETGYASVLKEIQAKYKEYLEGDFEDLEEKQIEEIQEIIGLGSLIDLWQSELPDRIVKNGESKGRSFTDKNVGPFVLTGLLKNFVELEEETDKLASISTVQRFINTLEKLKKIGVDVSRIQARDTIQTLAEKSGVSKDKIEKERLNPEELIGKIKNHIAARYRGVEKRNPPTREEVRRLSELGINLEKEKTAAQKFIEKLEKLQSIGVDVSKIQTEDTIEELAEKSGVSREKIQEVGLEVNDKIGLMYKTLSFVYRGTRKGIKPTEAEAQRLLELGISLEAEESAVQRFIEKLEKLQSIGVDVSKIQTEDTIEKLAEKSGIVIEKIEELGLNPNDKIGKNKTNISQVHRRNNKRGTKPTEEQLKRLSELGISLEKEKMTAAQKLIEKLEKLQSIGVDVSRIQARDTIQTLAEKSGISQEKIIEMGLDIKEKIGSKFNDVKTKKRENLIETDIRRLQKLRISLEQKTAAQKLIEKLEKLQSIGVDVSRIQARDTIQTLAEKSGISQEKIVEIGLRLDDNIGNSKSSICRVYNGKAKGNKPTEAEVQRLLELGVSLKEKENAVQRFIGKLEKLLSIGVDVSRIQAKDTIQTLAEKSGVSQEKIVEIGLRLDDNIGQNKHNVVSIYRGSGEGTRPTEEQVKRLLELGISLETRTRTGREIAEASISSLTDIEMTDREDVALTALVEKTKEGGIKANEQS